MEKQQEKGNSGSSPDLNGKGKRKTKRRVKASFEEALKSIREEDTELLERLAKQ
jgi:hypothetical protein